MYVHVYTYAGSRTPNPMNRMHSVESESLSVGTYLLESSNWRVSQICSKEKARSMWRRKEEIKETGSAYGRGIGENIARSRNSRIKV